MSNATRKKLTIILIILVIATIAFMWINSLMSKDDSQDVSRGLLCKIANALSLLGIYIDPTDDHWLRKLAHFSEYGLLGAELCALMFVNRRQCVQGFVNCSYIGLSVAVCDEALQLISERGSQVKDVLLDFSGCLTGLLLCGLICRMLINWTGKKE